MLFLNCIFFSHKVKKNLYTFLFTSFVHLALRVLLKKYWFDLSWSFEAKVLLFIYENFEDFSILIETYHMNNVISQGFYILSEVSKSIYRVDREKTNMWQHVDVLYICISNK